MKIKNDFVTNSSSTSFVAWGVSMETFKFEKQFGEKLLEIANAYNKEHNEEEFESVEKLFEDWVWVEHLDDLLDKDGVLSYHSDYDAGYVHIGGPPTSIKEDQTLRDFKEEIALQFTKLGMDMKPSDLVWLEEVSYG